MPLFWFVIFANRIKRIRDNIFFRCMARAQPTHMAYNMHTWGRVQLRRVAWDLYVQIPTFVAREKSNNKFTILEPVLLIASKRWVSYYPRVSKKEKQTRPTSVIVNQTNKVLLRVVKDTFLWCPSEALASIFFGLLALGWPWYPSLPLPLPLCLHIQFPWRWYHILSALNLHARPWIMWHNPFGH